MANEVIMNTTKYADMGHWIPQIWSKKVYEEAKAQMYWQRFSGPEGSGMPLIMKTELLTKPGDTINISQLANLSDSGVTGETRLTGTEEKLSTSQIQVVPEWNRHAVADTVKVDKTINQVFRNQAQMVLSYWLANKMDASTWTAASLTSAVGFEAAVINVIYGNDATSVNTIDSADTLGVAEIRKGAAVLESLNIKRVSVPGMPAGEGYYLMFVHPFQAYTLKQDSEWIANHQNASERGKDNPLFTGALGEVDGVIVHSTTQCVRAQNANSPVIYYSRAVMVGAEALCRGMNEQITWSEKVDDYEFEHGIGIRAAWQDKVLSAYANVHVVTASVDPSA